LYRALATDAIPQNTGWYARYPVQSYHRAAAGLAAEAGFGAPTNPSLFTQRENEQQESTI